MSLDSLWAMLLKLLKMVSWVQINASLSVFVNALGALCLLVYNTDLKLKYSENNAGNVSLSGDQFVKVKTQFLQR